MGHVGWPAYSVLSKSSPREVGRSGIQYPFGLAAFGNRAYIADGRGVLRVVDIADPTRAAEIGFYRLPPGITVGLDVLGKETLVAHRGTGLWILRVPGG
jgi:hypothetical protein